MTQASTIQIRQPWTLLHEPEARTPRLDQRNDAERAVTARKVELAMSRARDKAFTHQTLCSRPYF